MQAAAHARLSHWFALCVSPFERDNSVATGVRSWKEKRGGERRERREEKEWTKGDDTWRMEKRARSRVAGRRGCER